MSVLRYTEILSVLYSSTMFYSPSWKTWLKKELVGLGGLMSYQLTNIIVIKESIVPLVILSCLKASSLIFYVLSIVFKNLVYN